MRAVLVTCPGVTMCAARGPLQKVVSVVGGMAALGESAV